MWQSKPLLSGWRCVWEKWRNLQVGRQGSYSIERLESLDYYCKTTSRSRVVLVCILTPLPSLLLIVLLECLPLRPPSEGWASNWVFWIRLGITIFTMTFAGMTKLVAFAPDFNAALSKRLIVACGASAAYVATALLGANTIGFPIPMMWILGGSFMSIYVPVLALLVFGFAPFAKNSPCQQNMQRFSRYFFAYMTLAGVFPFYKVLYEFIPMRFRGIVIVVLPLWRLAAKQFLIRATRELEDFMPEIVAFTVDFFSALFVSVCMSTSGSMELAVLFVAADVGQSLLELHDVRTVSKADQLVASTWSRILFTQRASIVPAQESLLGPTTELVAEEVKKQLKTSQNTHTCAKHDRTVEKTNQVVRQGLQVLFHWEYVALVEYVECIVPLVFVAYKAILEQLPNIVYYPGGSGSLTMLSAVNILMFGALEIGSFFLLNNYLLRKFAFSPLYQLAFVLETQIYSVQTKLFIETVLLLQYELAHLGSYSIERLESLDLYCKTTSQIRVVLVCLLTPLPALAAALLLEVLPLRPPSEGLTANWVFWLRLLLMELILGFAGNSQVAAFVPGLPFTIPKRIIIAMGVAVCYLGTCLLAAKLIGFPVPLMMQFGRCSNRNIHTTFFFAHMTLIGVYPLYKVLYNHVPSSYRSIVVIVLPIWKFAAKSFVVRSTRQLEDYMPELVAFSVDFFGTLFVSVCMYSSGSIYLSGLFVLADLGQSLLEFREVHSNAKVVFELLADQRASQKNLYCKKGRRLSRLENTELLTMVVAYTRNPKAYNVKTLPDARLWSCIPHPITQEQLGHLQMLEALGIYSVQKPISNRPNLQHQPRFLQRLSVAPAPLQVMVPYTKRTDRSKKLAIQGLQLLFHCEYLALVEYIKCVVPLVFVTYKLVLRQLHNAVYYPNDDDNWRISSVVNLFVFAMLEVGSFVFLNALLRSKCAFSPLYQLAFVLETQMCPVQVHLFVALIILLQYELFHLGA
ncbi:Hypothetical protein PHPALM_9816 [Phytophthora palmivora]|uniref:Transmembrane protein n=1 Tax=Phytophthora palmivora TaxID=4796 RepID=A0A2P4Y6A2_9STRA|nr:Hypothetical protein PHPALM_9816 [Phytophthora palmivora]